MSGRGFGAHFYQFVHQNLKINTEVNKSLFSVPEFVGEKIHLRVISGAIFSILSRKMSQIRLDLDSEKSAELDQPWGGLRGRPGGCEAALWANGAERFATGQITFMQKTWWRLMPHTNPDFALREVRMWGSCVDLTRIKKLESASFLCNCVRNILPGL